MPPEIVTQAQAEQIAKQLAPGGAYSTPALIVGLDQGRLVDALWRTPASHPALPGYRTPIYVLCADAGQLEEVKRLRGWDGVEPANGRDGEPARNSVAHSPVRPLAHSVSPCDDKRVMFFCGADAAAQFQRTLIAQPRLPAPKMAVTVEPGLMPAGMNLDGLLQPVTNALNEKYWQAMGQLRAAYAGVSKDEVLRRIDGGKLRVLGITSRFTTFLQYSMRDWLGGMRRLGHETRLLIEEQDHELLNTLEYVRACADFKPDLILLIDHCRSEFGEALPAEIPAVMWIQDKLPNIFNREAGANQKPLDYTIGYGRIECVDTYGYPASRFMPAPVGVNEQRFAPRGGVTPQDVGKYECDVAYVSHCGAPVEEVVAQELAKSGTDVQKRLISDVFERMRGIYDAGGIIATTIEMRRIIENSAASLGFEVTDSAQAVDFFFLRVNSPLFRHQALGWIADLDVDIRLYGKGWETHPRFGRYARGVADNATALPLIYRLSRINLQLMPGGAVHQRLLEGLSAGGFFLLRHHPSDELHRTFKPLHEWCVHHGIGSDRDLRDRATPEVNAWLDETRKMLGADPFDFEHQLVHVLAMHAEQDFGSAAGAVWPEYERVAFASRRDLHAKVAYFLGHAEERRAIAASMRTGMLERFSYQSISARMLGMIREDLSRQGREAA